ncbi:thioredoxin domain-containing protein [Nitrosopumilus sp. b2]|uniref:DsbA family protein n=1 Tax=Nitrosopumilus sp. b2 TaxID=2109908 RepID=UPI001C717AD1|nr:thioredoxin domain-containing protein [Nitrosopumilus sp. b2]
MKYFTIIIGLMIIFSVQGAFAQEIPLWVKNSAQWWAEDSITDTDFVKGIEFLVNEKIIKVKTDSSENKKSDKIPTWVKNNAGWWADGTIEDADFLNGIQYLVSNGIISVNQKTANEKLVIGGFDLSNAGPFEGKADALFTIIMFSDHQCERCVNWLSHEKEIINKKLIDSGVAKFFVLDYPMLGEDSVSAAEASYCALEQGNYFEYIDILHKRYAGVQNGWASIDALTGYAKGLDLNFDEFDNCLFWDQQALRVDYNKKVALSHGVVGTPTFFVVGPDGQTEKIIGAQPSMIFDAVVKEMS